MLAVAHFRRKLFNPTETFLYNYLTSFRRIIPVCVTYQRQNNEWFPFQHPMVELYKWDLLHKNMRKFRRVLNRRYVMLKFDNRKTFATIDRYNVRVLHAHFGYTGSEILPVKQNTGLPLITTFYGEDVSALPTMTNWQLAYGRLFSEGDQFLVEGPNMRKRLIAIGCPFEKIKIQRIALHMNRYPFRPRTPKTKNQNVRILFCGSFREKKGLMYALEVVQRVYQKYSNIEFYIIGDGELRPQVENYINLNRMHNYTRLLGFLSHKQMIETMDSADIFIHPSVTAENGDSEGGAPTTILEAQACGLPVLSTTHADIPNIVVPEKSALLAPERDVDTLFRCLYHLLSQKEQWAEMGSVGRDFVEKYHNITHEVSLLEDHYFSISDLANT